MSVTIQFYRRERPWGVVDMRRAQRTHSLHGHRVDVLLDAMCGYLRRGDVDGAVYCAFELDGFAANPHGAQVVNLLLSTLVEFALTYGGISAPLATVDALQTLGVYHMHWQFWTSETESMHRRDTLASAVERLARAAKQRVVLAMRCVFFDRAARGTGWRPPGRLTSLLNGDDAYDVNINDAQLSPRAYRTLEYANAWFDCGEGEATMPDSVATGVRGLLYALDLHSERSLYWAAELTRAATLARPYAFSLRSQRVALKRETCLFVVQLCVAYWRDNEDEFDQVAIDESALRVQLVCCMYEAYWRCPKPSRDTFTDAFVAAVVLVASRARLAAEFEAQQREEREWGATRIAALMAHRRRLPSFAYQFPSADARVVELKRTRADRLREQAVLVHEHAEAGLARDDYALAHDLYTDFCELVERRTKRARQRNSPKRKR